MRLARIALVTATALLVALPATAQRRGPYEGINTLRLRVGEFQPRGDGDYWFDKANDFTGSERSFEDTRTAIDYSRAIGRRMSVVLSASSWEADAAQQYRDFVDTNGGPIFHTTSFEMTSVSAGLLVHLADRGSTLSPYLGAGGGFYDWTLVEEGDFIDFTDLTIFSDRFSESNDTFGWYWVAGLDVPVGDEFRLFAETRWDRVDDDLAGDFAGLGTLDLSGRTISFGAGWSF